MMLLKDRVAVVTGGTRGIGYAIVKKYLENGAKAVLFGSKEESVNKAVQSLKAENPDWVVEGMWPNLTDSEEMEQAIAKVGEKYGRLDILVNNAGVSQSTKLEDYQPEDFAGIMNLNVNALFNAIQPAVKIMRAQGGGVILNTSSMVSISGQPSGVSSHDLNDRNKPFSIFKAEAVADDFFYRCSDIFCGASVSRSVVCKSKIVVDRLRASDKSGAVTCYNGVIRKFFDRIH